MGTRTEIQWTDHTLNPWLGCQEVSPGCDHCYAATLASTRMGYNDNGRTHPVIWGPPRTTPRHVTGAATWSQPLRWNRDAQQEGRQHRVFCASMADIFEFHPQLDEPRARLWDLVEATPHLDWQLLTKRPMNILRMVPASWRAGLPANVWIGTSVEDQERANLRIPHLVRVPARVRFLSCEPLLGPVDLTPWLDELHWVITGGESGPRARSLDPDWVRGLRDQCQTAGVALFHKQNGGRTPKAGGRDLDGRTWDEFPMALEVRP